MKTNRARGMRLLGVVLISLGLITPAEGPALAGAVTHESASTVGAWGAPIELGIVGIHAVMLPTGEVMLFTLRGDYQQGTDVRIYDPADGSVTAANPPGKRDMFCSGTAILPDGRVFIVGGALTDQVGVKLTNVFDPVSRTWSGAPPLEYPRWYPTPITMPSGRVLIFSGQHTRFEPTEPIEAYRPWNNTMRSLPASASRYIGSYPRLHLLPDGKVFWNGEEGTKVKGLTFQQTALFDPARKSWTGTGPLKGGTHYQAPSVLLPGLQKVLVPGGTVTDDLTSTAATNIIDFGDPKPGWRLTTPMNFPREQNNTVLLADGTALVVGGGDSGFYDGPVKEPEIFDPVTETWSVMAPQQFGRMHHSTAVLLPDGRVFTAGQDFGDGATTAEIFSPPYLSQGPRPEISSVPQEVGYGAAMPISTPDAAGIARVALVRPGSVTHGVDFEQRYVDLSFSNGAGVVNATSPQNGAQAPPGWYMLFLVDTSGVPSVASWVHLA